MQNQFNAALKNNSLFKNTNISNISLDDLDLNIKFLEEGEVLFKSGDPASSIFLVIDGEINLLRKRSFSKTTTAIVSPNEFFGQEEFFNNGNRHSTALAIRDSKLVELTSDNLDALLVQYNGIFNNIKENLEDVDESIIKNLFVFEGGYSSVGTDDETGSGLGLILCKEFTEINGGKIWVESKEGKGTTFSFTIPLSVKS